MSARSCQDYNTRQGFLCKNGKRAMSLIHGTYNRWRTAYNMVATQSHWIYSYMNILLRNSKACFNSIHKKLQFEGNQSKGQMPIAKLKYLVANGDLATGNFAPWTSVLLVHRHWHNLLSTACSSTSGTPLIMI
jgi:hypothetical protein